MTSWFKHVAVLAAWLGLGTMVLAQLPGRPSPVGATRIPEPLNYIPEGPPPQLTPGPLNPLMAPAGPPDSLNLPADHFNAFPTEGFPMETAFFASLGGMALMREGLNSTPIVFADDQNNRIDTGGEPIGILPILFPLDRVHPLLQGGVRATVGYLFATEAVELTGFYIPYKTEFGQVIDQGRLFIPFGPPNFTPLGFEGNNGLWRQADYARISYTGGLASAEANYRRWNAGLNHVELILGVRYLYMQERIDIYADDEFFVRDIFDRPDPLRAATYTAGTRNNYLGLQFGGEYSTPIPHEKLSWIWFTLMGKTSLGANFIERTWRLTRGDGFGSFDIHQNTIMLGSVNEGMAGVDIHILERLRFRAGYTAIWALGFSSADRQIDFNFQTQGQRGTDRTSILWHGPMAELQFLF